MPVVSKGEFTVSRLDDGVSSHLHVGWLMADDRFTTIYPAENLWVKSSSASGYLVANGTVVGPDAFNRVSDYIPITPGKKYIYQTDVIVSKEDKLQSWNGLCFYDASKALVGARLVQQGSTVAVGTKVHTEWPLTAPAGASFIRIGSRYLEDGVAKFESGATPTIYTPAPADDYSLAYPKYRGEYTDTIAADSTDPNRYTWTAYLGEQGPPTGIISQNTVPSSPYVGMLWQCTGNIAGYINPATYRWNGSAWEIYQFTAQNILAETFTGFVFQGVEFIGSRFVNEWTDSQANRSGRTKIEEGEYTTGYWANGSKDENLTAGGEFRISKDGILTNNWKDTTVNKSQGYVLNDQFLEFFSNGRSDITFTGRLTAETLSQMNLMHTRVSEVIRYPGATDVITPSMALDKTYTGWMLEFCGMMNGTPTEGDLCYVIVPKFLKDKTQPVIMSPRITVHGGADSRKILYITNTTITGHANNAAAPSNGAVLRRVYVI